LESKQFRLPFLQKQGVFRNFEMKTDETPILRHISPLAAGRLQLALEGCRVRRDGVRAVV
jgi:hypothetical protein